MSKNLKGALLYGLINAGVGFFLISLSMGIFFDWPIGMCGMFAGGMFVGGFLMKLLFFKNKK